MHLTLPSGGWAELRDPSTLRARDQKALLKSMNFEQDNKVAAGLDMADGLIALLVTAWEIPYARALETNSTGEMVLGEMVLPSVDVTVIDDLSLADYGELTRIARDVQKVMFPAPPDPSDYEDPSSPTGPANA